MLLLVMTELKKKLLLRTRCTSWRKQGNMSVSFLQSYTSNGIDYMALPERGRPWEFKFLTIDHIYRPLARSNGKVLALARSSKHANGDKNNKIHQFLSEIGVKALRT